MNKFLYLFAIIYPFITTSAVFAMEKTNAQPLKQMYQRERRSLRAALKPLWQTTPMPEVLKTCSTKKQTNCIFLAAVHYAAVNKTENYSLIAWILDYRDDQQFSLYMKRIYQNKLQEFHINPQYVATTNKDYDTLNLLQQHDHVQAKIPTGVFYLPGPLLWACIGNDVTQAQSALSDTKEMAKLIQDPECVIDCVHVALQNGSVDLANTLLEHDIIKKIYFASGSSHSPRVSSSTTSEKKPLLLFPKKQKKSSKSKSKKHKSEPKQNPPSRKATADRHL